MPTCSRKLRERLMCSASRSAVPRDPVFASRSEPAKSTSMICATLAAKAMNTLSTITWRQVLSSVHREGMTTGLVQASKQAQVPFSVPLCNAAEYQYFLAWV